MFDVGPENNWKTPIGDSCCAREDKEGTKSNGGMVVDTVNFVELGKYFPPTGASEKEENSEKDAGREFDKCLQRARHVSQEVSIPEFDVQNVGSVLSFSLDENKEFQVFDKSFHGDKAGFPASFATLTDGTLTKVQSELNYESFVLTELWLFELIGIFIDQAMWKELNETEGLNVITRMNFNKIVTSWFLTSKLFLDKLVRNSVAGQKEVIVKGPSLREIVEEMFVANRYIWCFQHDLGMHKDNLLVDKAILLMNMVNYLLDTGQVTLLLVNIYYKDDVVEDFITNFLRFWIHNPNLGEFFDASRKQSDMNNVNRVNWWHKSYFGLHL